MEEVNKQHNLYLLQSDSNSETLLKFGYSANINSRLKTYYRHNPKIKIVKTFYREDAFSFESLLHSKFKAVYGNEWYPIHYKDDILKFIEENSKNLLSIKPKNNNQIVFLDSDFININEASEMFNVSPSTITRFARRYEQTEFVRKKKGKFIIQISLLKANFDEVSIDIPAKEAKFDYKEELITILKSENDFLKKVILQQNIQITNLLN
jgi:hypothetical protein